VACSESAEGGPAVGAQVDGLTLAIVVRDTALSWRWTGRECPPLAGGGPPATPTGGTGNFTLRVGLRQICGDYFRVSESTESL
jgi:hypothetical protein